MKKLLLFTAFLVTAPLFSGYNELSIDEKDQYLKSKIHDANLNFIFLTDKQRVYMIFLLNACLNGNLTATGSSNCSIYKNILLGINDLSDRTLKRRFLSYIFQFKQDERRAIDYMANVVDKNVERAKIRAQLEEQDSSLKEKVLDDLGYSFLVADSWWNYFNYSTTNLENFRLDLEKCLYQQNLDKDRNDGCLVIRKFIKNYIPKLDSNDKQTIAQIIADVIDANSAYNQAILNYKDSLKDLYTQD